jgi:FMN-dependent NADH-azoreductase
MPETTKVLRVDSSLNPGSSVSRALADRFQARLESQGPTEITYRDVAQGIERITSDWVEANITPIDQRNEQHEQSLAYSDGLVAELMDADILLISSPIYNFGVTADMKAWTDNICRAGVTFRYTEHGPRGLIEGKKAYVVLASGGTPVNSEIDFCGRYLKQILNFLNITDQTFFTAEQLRKFDPIPIVAAAEKEIDAFEF